MGGGGRGDEKTGGKLNLPNSIFVGSIMFYFPKQSILYPNSIFMYNWFTVLNKNIITLVAANMAASS